MHLRKVTLKNFRCFGELELLLHPRLTVLVAENGGGKTTVLDGIAIGLGPLLHSFSSANQRLDTQESGLLPQIEDTDFTQVPSTRAKAGDQWVASDYTQISLESTDGLKWDVHKRSAADSDSPSHNHPASDLVKYASNVMDSIKTGSPHLMPIVAYYGATRGFIEIPERIRDSKINYSYPSSALVGALNPKTDFKEMLKWFDLADASELRALREIKNAPDFTGSPDLTIVREALSALLGGAYEDPQFNEKHKFVVKAKSGPGVLQVAQLSQGYQSMLALGMDFARRLALANPDLEHFIEVANWRTLVIDYISKWNPDTTEVAPAGPIWAPAIMLVDEIDLHLHPSWQQRVLHDLMKAFPSTQFIVTSHSPQVLSTVPTDSIRIIEDGKVCSAPPGTDGAEVQRILEGVFGVARRPHTKMALLLDEYLRLVDERQWDSERAVELRAKLDTWSMGQEPCLLEADLQIENLRWEAGL